MNFRSSWKSDGMIDEEFTHCYTPPVEGEARIMLCLQSPYPVVGYHGRLHSPRRSLPRCPLCVAVLKLQAKFKAKEAK